MKLSQTRLGMSAVYLAAALLTLGCVVGYQAIMQPSPRAYAALNTEASCISGSGADSVTSVQQACHKCFSSSYSNSARGTLWFNSSSSNRNSDVVQVADPTATTVDIYLWGQTFACNESPTTSTAYHIWFGQSGKDTNISTEAVSYLSPNDASRS